MAVADPTNSTVAIGPAARPPVAATKTPTAATFAILASPFLILPSALSLLSSNPFFAMALCCLISSSSLALWSKVSDDGTDGFLSVASFLRKVAITKLSSSKVNPWLLSSSLTNVSLSFAAIFMVLGLTWGSFGSGGASLSPIVILLSLLKLRVFPNKSMLPF